MNYKLSYKNIEEELNRLSIYSKHWTVNKAEKGRNIEYILKYKDRIELQGTLKEVYLYLVGLNKGCDIITSQNIGDNEKYPDTLFFEVHKYSINDNGRVPLEYIIRFRKIEGKGLNKKYYFDAEITRYGGGIDLSVHKLRSLSIPCNLINIRDLDTLVSNILYIIDKQLYQEYLRTQSIDYLRCIARLTDKVNGNKNYIVLQEDKYKNLCTYKYYIMNIKIDNIL